MPDINDLRRIRKEQIHTANLTLWRDRGVVDFSAFNPTKILAGDLWRCTADEVTVNGLEGNVKMYKNDIVVALEDNANALTYENINAGAWHILRSRPIGTGAKKTGVDGGYIWEQSFVDDFYYVCTVPGNPETSEEAGDGTAVWKRIQLHST